MSGDEYIYKESEESKRERINRARLEHVGKIAKKLHEAITNKVQPDPAAIVEEFRDQVEDMIVYLDRITEG